MSFGPLRRPHSANVNDSYSKKHFDSISPRNSPTNIYGNTCTAKKTPTSAEVAVNVFRKVSSVTGVENIEKGKSIFDQVNHLRTDPAVHLLLKKSWRTFFSEMESVEEAEAAKPSTADLNDTSAPLKSSLHIENNENTDKNKHLSKLHKNMLRRVHSLWKELKIPDSDRDYYSHNILAKKCKEETHLQEVASYIKVLLSHREDTLVVLRAISNREQCVANCMGHISWAHKKGFIRLKTSSAARATTGAALESASKEGEVQGGDIPPPQEEAEVDSWKENVRRSVQEVQFATVDVVQRIQIWRQHLWRPLAFK